MYGTLPAAASSLLVGGLSNEPLLAVGGVGGYLLGAYVSPDLDLVGLNSDESRMMRHFGPLGVLFVMWWLPYAYLMRFVGIGKKGHRNFFSHFPVISTAIRLVWMLLIPAALLWYFSILIPVWVWWVLGGAWFGLSIADTLHFIGDIV